MFVFWVRYFCSSFIRSPSIREWGSACMFGIFKCRCKMALNFCCFSPLYRSVWYCLAISEAFQWGSDNERLPNHPTRPGHDPAGFTQWIRWLTLISMSECSWVYYSVLWTHESLQDKWPITFIRDEIEFQAENFLIERINVNTSHITDNKRVHSRS